MKLPIIRPLNPDAPRWIVDEDGKQACGCNFCQHWLPIMERVESQLDEETKKLFNEYVSYIEQKAEDGDAANAKLEGNWPGWEAMKDKEALQKFLTSEAK